MLKDVNSSDIRRASIPGRLGSFLTLLARPPVSGIFAVMAEALFL
jgi:hypothetical protein